MIELKASASRRFPRASEERQAGEHSLAAPDTIAFVARGRRHATSSMRIRATKSWYMIEGEMNLHYLTSEGTRRWRSSAKASSSIARPACGTRRASRPTRFSPRA